MHAAHFAPGNSGIIAASRSLRDGWRRRAIACRILLLGMVWVALPAYAFGTDCWSVNSRVAQKAQR